MMRLVLCCFSDDLPRQAVRSAKTARTALASVIVTAPEQLREELRHLPAARRAR